MFQIEEKKQELKENQDEHDKQKFFINSQLSIKKKEEERKSDKNEETEQKYTMGREELRQHVSHDVILLTQLILKYTIMTYVIFYQFNTIVPT